MITFLKKDIEQFKEMGVLAVYLFGSMATGKYIHGLSDYDFGVVVKNPEKLKEGTLELYNRFYDIIIDKLPKAYLKKRFELKAHEVDIVFMQNATVYFQANVVQQGKVLYCSDKRLLDAYKEYVLERFCDLQYVYKLSHEALLERILKNYCSNGKTG